MQWRDLGADGQRTVEEVLGYLNFSSGASDTRFLGKLNRLFGQISGSHTRDGEPEQPAWRNLAEVLREGLGRLRKASVPFREAGQADAVLKLVFDEALVAFRLYHRDLLFHQSDEDLFQPFFIGRMCEVVLGQGPPWENTDRIVQGAIKRLNDFIGHRPVAVLETGQKLQPYEHEWVRPVPLYIAGAGVAVGRYHDLISKALEIFAQTDAQLLEKAWFDPGLVAELAVDPRAYDFDHPVNKRPNYHFGGWDPHCIDNRGYFRRFVLQQVTLDALLARLDERQDLPRDEILFEAAGVLAGTMLMGSGITGSRPDCHDSSVTLASLLPIIAAYREEFYETLWDQVPETHLARLREEADRLKQPFGAARQHLNHRLARDRARQLQHVNLAQVFARMGDSQSAARQARVVPVASARMRCEVACRIAGAHLAADRGDLTGASAVVPEVEDLLRRGIECGAFVDPWNILGFGGHYSLFPALENSVQDHRIDELIDLTEGLFGLYARLQKDAAATGQSGLVEQLAQQLGELAGWWDQFASTEVSGVDGISGQEVRHSIAQVAGALAAWREAGTAAGDIGFWRKHVQEFRSPNAFAMLVHSLLEKRDFVASMALLMYWLNQADQIPLAEGETSFHGLAIRWMDNLWYAGAAEDGGSAAGPLDPQEQSSLTKKFFDYLEANADHYWEVPALELGGRTAREDSPAEDEDDEPDDGSEDLFAAAYEDVTYRDTTADGFEGEIADGGTDLTDFELVGEGERILDRVAFLGTLAESWKRAAAASWQSQTSWEDRNDRLAAWLSRAMENRAALANLVDEVHRYRVPDPDGTQESMVEYDRRRAIKETLLERVIATCVETADAVRCVLATMDGPAPNIGLNAWESQGVRVLKALTRGDRRRVGEAWPDLLEALGRERLLYAPTARGGSPHRVLASRSIQRLLDQLLIRAPRLGALRETYELLETIHNMERRHPAGPGAITEYDRLFEYGCRGIVDCLVASFETWRTERPDQDPRPDGSDVELIECLERAVEQLLRRWIAHSRNTRISVLESVADNRRWRDLKNFIKRYGNDLFTQPFMNIGNLRAILHQGVESFLQQLEEDPDPEEEIRLLRDLGVRIKRDDAAILLELAIDAVVENYPEYIDYNSTTTQSDRGEMLYALLDFLRLRANYDRVSWNLRPVMTAHDVLVRRGRVRAAEQWRVAVAERTKDVADEQLARFESKCQQYGMKLASVAARINERFVRPLDIDRLCAMVRPAIEELRSDGPRVAIEMLETEVARFSEEPCGVGFDLPSWLEALEEEVDRVLGAESSGDEPDDPLPVAAQVCLTRDEVEQALDQASEEEQNEP